MSSVAQNSYLSGNALSGAASDLERLESVVSSGAALEGSGRELPGPCEFLRLLGDTGCEETLDCSFSACLELEGTPLAGCPGAGAGLFSSGRAMGFGPGVGGGSTGLTSIAVADGT